MHKEQSLLKNPPYFSIISVFNMHRLLYTMPSRSSSSKPLKLSSYSSSNPNPNPTSSSSSSSSSSALLCKHSPSATLDILILILVFFSGISLLTSYFSYIFCSLSILLSNSSFHLAINVPSISYICGFLALFLFSVLFVEFCCGPRSRKCVKPGCKGLKKAMEFDLQSQAEDCVKYTGAKEIDKLPWKGGSEGLWPMWLLMEEEIIANCDGFIVRAPLYVSPL